MNIEANKKLWAKIVAKAWCDEAYKAELLNNPEKLMERPTLPPPPLTKREYRRALKARR